MNRIAGDKDILFSRGDDAETRKSLVYFVADNFLQTLQVAQGKTVSIKIMFDAEITP